MKIMLNNLTINPISYSYSSLFWFFTYLSVTLLHFSMLEIVMLTSIHEADLMFIVFVECLHDTQHGQPMYGDDDDGDDECRIFTMNAYPLISCRL